MRRGEGREERKEGEKEAEDRTMILTEDEHEDFECDDERATII